MTIQGLLYLEYPLEAGVMDWPSCDLAQEADLTAQVVMEVSQAPVVTVVHPAMEESLKPFHFNFKWKHGTRSFNRSVSDQHKYQLTLAAKLQQQL